MSSSKAPKTYQPTGQGAADAGLQAAIGAQTPWANQLPAATIPQYQNLTNQTVNNPYYPGAQAGANQTAATAMGQVAPQQLNASTGMYDLSGAAANAAPGALAGMSSALPQFNQAAQGAAGALNQSQQLVPYATQSLNYANPMLQGALDQIPGATGGYGVGAQAYGQQSGLAPSALQGMGYANPALAGAMGMANQTSQGGQYAPGAMAMANSAIPGTTGGAALAPGVANMFGGLAGNTAGMAGNFGQLAQQAQGMGGYGQQGGQAAGGILGQSMGDAQNAYNTAFSGIPATTQGMGYANQIMGTAFDSQNALYDRGYQQTMDKQNALNSMYGLGSSAAGAGLAGDASRNYDIDWQNQQLQRQIAGMGAYNQTSGQTASNLAGLVGAGSQAYSQLANTGVGAYTGLTSNASQNGLNALGMAGNLQSQGVGANTAAGNLLSQGTDAYTGLTGSTANNLSTLLGAGTNAYNSLNSTAANNYGSLMNAGVGAYTGLNDSSFNNYNNTMNSGVNNYNAGTNSAATNYANLLGAGSSAYGNMMSGGIQNYLGLLGGGTNAYSDMLGAGTNAYSGLMNGSTGAFGALSGAANQSAGTASDLGSAGLNTMATGSQMPNQAYLQNIAAQIAALNSQQAGTAGALAPLQSIGNQNNSYLQTGNAADNTRVAAYQAQQQANQAMWSNIIDIGKTASGFIPIPH